MTRDQGNGLSLLDQVLVRQGGDRLRHMFRRLAKQDRSRAVRHLRDERLGFPALFQLLPELEALNFYEELTPRCAAAAGVCARKAGKRCHPKAEQALQNPDTLQDALRWMLRTSLLWEGRGAANDSFDAVLDTAAAKLIGAYGDKSVLPVVCELIFRRNRRGLLIHDLVWSYFQARDVEALKLVARRLLSSEPRDVELACKLLHLTPGRPGMDARQKLYRQYMEWLERNRPYLRFTGEEFQETSHPNPVQVDPEARYLGKAISPRDGKPLQPLTRREQILLERLRTLPEAERKALVSYSASLHDRDPRQWRQWLEQDITGQILAAKADQGAEI